MNRRFLPLLLIGVVASMGASYRTPNFVVHAPTPQIAEQIGKWAEHYRKEKAQLWLGREMPPWPQPCPVIVQVSMEGPSGATSFNFGQGQVLSQKMEIRGPLDRLIASVLPHEITHTVFAYYFRTPVPRWADEGGSVLSEDDLERDRHDKLVRSILNQGRQIPVRRLFSLREYPREVMCLYAEGFSISDYLVKRSDRQTFLQFVAAGMQSGWDGAAQRYYGHRNVEELEGAWLQHLKDTRRQPGVQLAGNAKGPAGTATASMVRTTAPPYEPSPLVRGQAPVPEQMGQRFGDGPGMPVQVPYNPVGQGWQPVQPGPQFTPAFQSQPVPIQLGPPQFETNPMQFPTQPVGFPR
ncbi:MAG TPA: hypothetical protein VKE98_06890 [Gemmataceae bacterium]|nr:hypothetical protein [Gemmataceae bacterium]